MWWTCEKLRKNLWWSFVNLHLKPLSFRTTARSAKNNEMKLKFEGRDDSELLGSESTPYRKVCSMFQIPHFRIIDKLCTSKPGGSSKLNRPTGTPFSYQTNENVEFKKTYRVRRWTPPLTSPGQLWVLNGIQVHAAFPRLEDSYEIVLLCK